MKRRDLLKISALAGLAATATHASADTCAGDGTPAQFVPKKPADAKCGGDKASDAKKPADAKCGAAKCGGEKK